ncbi:MAG: LytTR family DNA-binding domain-containing protein [Enterocloster sp.]
MPGITATDAARKKRLPYRPLPAVESYQGSITPTTFNTEFDKLSMTILFQLFLLLLKTSTGIIRLLISNVVFVEVQNHLVTFKMADGTFHTASGRLADYEKLLVSRSFFKPHRSYLINLHQVTGLNKMVFPPIGKIVPVSRDTYTKAKSAYMNYLLNGRLEENGISNLTIIIYAIAVMTMLLDTTPARLSRNKLSLLWTGAGMIALLQFFASCVLGIKIYLRFYFFFAQLPVFLLLLAAFRQRTGENFFSPSALFL